MLLSRFWYIILAIVAAAGAAAALLAQSAINGRSDEALAETLRRDRTMVEAVLRLEARSRLDRIAFITVDAKLGGLLKQAHEVTDEKKLRALGADAKTAMRGHVVRIVESAGSSASSTQKQELEPNIAFAVDLSGRIIGQLGPLETNPPGASLATFPLVRRALQGYVRDDVWVYDRRVYRMAARPVMAGTEYAGAIIHGYAVDTGLPETLAKYLGGATVAFFQGADVLSSYVPTDVAGAPQRAELAIALPPLLAGGKLKPGTTGDVISLQGGGRAVFAPIVGNAGALGVGYSVARPRRLMTSPEQLFEQASKDDLKSLPMPQLGGGAVLLALIGLLFVYVERDRHLSQLIKKTGEIGAGERDRLTVTEWRGGYRGLADKINQAIDKEVEKAAERAPTTRKRANLDEILGPTPEATGTPFFGFASSEPGTPQISPAASTPQASPIPKPSSAQPQPRPAARPLPPVPAPALPLPPVRAVPEPVTTTASIVTDGENFDENAHWHEVYEQYVVTRRQCGEPTDTLTFEKFAITLKKTRDQIVEKHNARIVRFAVQVKEGKAALKAQPVKR